jgi:2-polyprenyl-6-methoxyphenol hydroxylase-like FAD-dependent oxidoreductase
MSSGRTPTDLVPPPVTHYLPGPVAIALRERESGAESHAAPDPRRAARRRDPAGRQCRRLERDGEPVRLLLDDDTAAESDVLVDADGVYSAIRRTLMPDVEVIDTGVCGLGVFARTPLPPDVHDALPEILLSGFVIAVDPATGVTLALGAMDPRRPPDEAATDVAPDVRLDPVAPYMMLTGGIRPGTPIPAPGEWSADTPAAVHAQMVEAVSGWHPARRGLVERIELDTMFASNFMRLDPTPPWTPSNVTLVGDAIHAMLPTLGMGGTPRSATPPCSRRSWRRRSGATSVSSTRSAPSAPPRVYDVS